MRSRKELSKALTLVRELRRKNKQFLIKDQKNLRRAEELFEIIESNLTRSIEELSVDNEELAKSLLNKISELRKKLSELPEGKKEYLDFLKRVSSYVSAAYYDFTGRIGEIKRAYRMYITSFVIALVLLPIFLGAGVLLIGFLLFPLFLSIHAYRARRKLGIFISSALFPLIIFIGVHAVYYMLYSLVTSDELGRISSALQVDLITSVAIVIALGVAGLTALVMAIKSFLTLYRNISAFI